MTGATHRPCLWPALLCGALWLGVCIVAGQHPHPALLLWTWPVLGCLGLLLWLVWPHPLTPRTTLLCLGVLFAVSRVAFWGYPPSDDMHRYLWEARLVGVGGDPYAGVAAEAPEHLRDADWERMNHRDRLTAYPPGILLLMAAVGALHPSAAALKALFLLAEALLAALVLLMLHRRGRSLSHGLLYLLSPVALWATAAEAHFDSIFVLALLGALLSADNRRWGLAWALLALAVHVKVVAVLLIPLLLVRGGLGRSWVGALALLLPALPYLESLPNLLQGILFFGGATAHNGSLHAVLSWALGSVTAASAVSGLILALWTALVLWRVQSLLRAAFYLLAGLLVCTSILHPWYLLWLLPLLTLFPSAAWLALTILVGAYYTAPLQALGGGPWAQPLWAWLFQWVPFTLLLLPDLRRLPALLRPREAPGKRPETPTSLEHLDILIPTLNEAGHLPACLASIRTAAAALPAGQAPWLKTVYIADGGSTDGTVAIAREAGASVVAAPRGRGNQLAAAYAASDADVVLILHADALLTQESLARLHRALCADPEAVGGVLGQRFAGGGFVARGIEGLNRLRAALFGMSFGDQGQFVRKAALPPKAFPAQPLMEDVELALRLRARGPVLYLGDGVTASLRRWRREAWWLHVFTVIRLLLVYRLERLRGRNPAEVLYRLYYDRDVGGPGV